jgi:DNA integrity scanning protein DisA with diadenylate cyclase activity
VSDHQPDALSPAARENLESRELVRSAFALAGTLGIRKLLVQADGVEDVRVVQGHRKDEKIIWLTRGPMGDPVSKDMGRMVLTLPETSTLTRMSQISVGLFLAVLRGYVEVAESVLCLSGIAGSSRLDVLWIANPRRDFHWLGRQDVAAIPERLPIRELGRLLEIALRFAAEGREGHPIGTIFVLGDPEELEPHLRQLVLNPCLGHPRRARSIHNPEFLETLREYAAMDGAFVVGARGVVEAAATYLAATGLPVRIRQGLGARHAAAASITATTSAVAIVVSASSGSITVFHEGSPILELERPLSRIQR